VGDNAEFNYGWVEPQNLSAFYETNLFKVRTNPGFNFGTLKDLDG